MGPLLIKKEVAQIFRVNETKVDLWVRLGWLHPINVSTSGKPVLRYCPDELEKLKERLQSQSHPERKSRQRNRMTAEQKRIRDKVRADLGE